MGLIEDTVNTLPLEDLTPDPPPEQGAAPKLTAQLITEIVALLKNPAKNGGFLEISMTKGVLTSDVKLIWYAMQRRISDLSMEI